MSAAEWKAGLARKAVAQIRDSLTTLSYAADGLEEELGLTLLPPA